MRAVKKIALILSAITWLSVVAVLIASVRLSVVQVLSESMVPTLNVGDSVLASKCSAKEVKVGDIIVYWNDRINANIIHRVIDRAVTVNDDGSIRVVLTTKGDNNAGSDSDGVTDANNIRKVSNSVSVETVTKAVGIVKSPIGLITLALLLIIGPWILTASKKDDKPSEKDNNIREISIMNVNETNNSNSVDNGELKEVPKTGNLETVKNKSSIGRNVDTDDDIKYDCSNEDYDSSEDGWRHRFNMVDGKRKSRSKKFKYFMLGVTVVGLAFDVYNFVQIVKKLKKDE